MGIILFPWQVICTAHPLGHSHEHHEEGKLSPCELYRKYVNEEGHHILPPMHCHHLSADTDDYQTQEKFQIKPSFQTIAILAVLYVLIKFDNSKQPYLFAPDPKCRSATLASDNPLRGPPIV